MSSAVVLTVDLGTSATKAGLWSGDRLAAMGRAPIETRHPHPGWAEQAADAWWTSLIESSREVRAAAPGLYDQVEAIGFSAARESFVPVDEELRPLGPGILWSDQRAAAEASRLGDSHEFRARTGVVLNGAAHAAKVVWLRNHAPERFEGARWLLAPRDFIVSRITGEVVTDPSLASRTGWFGLRGGWTEQAQAIVGDRLPPVRPSTTIVDGLHEEAAGQLGLRWSVAVVLGAGDRACETLGAGATATRPMVSWGTTSNVSVPLVVPVERLPTVAAVSFGALGGHVLEAGLSASGAALGWLATLTGRRHDELLADAARVEPGARGVLALPWLHGARAPWWRSDARGAFVGLTGAHGPAELARAIIEGVALDVARCLELVAPDAHDLALAGGGAAHAPWPRVLAAATGRPAVRRRLDEAASVGARIVVGAALGQPVEVDELNPVVARETPDDRLVRVYRDVRPRSDAAAHAVLGLEQR